MGKFWGQRIRELDGEKRLSETNAMHSLYTIFLLAVVGEMMEISRGNEHTCKNTGTQRTLSLVF